MARNHVNLPHRLAVFRAMTEFLEGKTTNQELSDAVSGYFYSDDGAVRGVMYKLWSTYEDGIRTFTLADKPPEAEELADFKRTLCFLRTDLTYKWPDGKVGCWYTLLYSILYSFLSVITFGLAGKLLDRRYQSTGDPDYWPFLNKEEYEGAMGVLSADERMDV